MNSFRTILSIVVLTFLFTIPTNIFAGTFTAIASGDWSNSLTWGGASPGANITSEDVIIISAGVSVNLDVDVEINNNLAELRINGILISDDNDLTITAGSCQGLGSLSIKELELGTNATFSLNGQATVATLVNSSNQILTSVLITVENEIRLEAGAFQLGLGTTLLLQNNTTVEVVGGTLIQAAGILNLTGSINLVYSGNSIGTGLELTGGAIQNIEINLDNSNAAVSLNNHLIINGTLTLTQGQLELNGNNLTINGNIAAGGNGSLSLHADSDIIINSQFAGTLVLTENEETCDDFVLNGNVTLGATLEISGDLMLQSGDLTLAGFDLTLNGNSVAIGTGSVTGHINSDISFMTSGNVGVFVFTEGAEDCHDFTINGDVELGSDLTINGSLNLMNGALILSGNTLEIGGTINGSGSGTISSDTEADIIISGSINAGVLVFTENEESCDDFIVNGDVKLGSNITVNGNLNLQAGTLTIGNNNLEIAGSVESGVSATITGGINSNIAVTGEGEVGILVFTENENQVNNLEINITNGSIVLDSELEIMGTLTLELGQLVLENGNLTIDANAEIEGGSNNSFVLTTGENNLTLNVEAGASAMFPVGTSIGFFPCEISQNPSAATTEIMVHVATGVFAEGTTGTDLTTTASLVNNTWFVEAADANAELNLDFEFFWNASAEVNGFNNANCYISHFTENEWDVATTAQATAQANGSFSITRSGITSLSPFRVADDGTVGLFATPEQIDFQFYPNPTTDLLQIQIPQNVNSTKVTIMNLQGQIIKVVEISNQKFIEINVEELNSGMYLMQLEGASTQRFNKI